MAKKAVIKTSQNDASVEVFLDSVKDPQKRAEADEILKLMQSTSKEKPKMWGASLIGFGERLFRSPSGREVDWFLIGFSPRKANFSLYVLNGFPAQEDLLAKLGKHKTGQGCLYINKLSDIDKKVLKQIVEASFKKIKAMPE